MFASNCLNQLGLVGKGLCLSIMLFLPLGLCFANTVDWQPVENTSWTGGISRNADGAVNVGASSFDSSDNGSNDDSATIEINKPEEPLPADASFLIYQYFTGASEGSAFSLGAWNYTRNDWTAHADASSTRTIRYQLPHDEWLALCLYDQQAGQIAQVVYPYRDAWQGAESAMNRMAAANSLNPAAGPSASNDPNCRVSAVQQVAVYSHRLAYVGCWDYASDSWVSETDDSGNFTFDYPVRNDSWMAICIMDYETGEWTDAIYQYHQDFSGE
ncbi:MAG: hypothetical protein ACLFQ6_12445 [Candidatus Sumerlaeia bacterium]